MMGELLTMVVLWTVVIGLMWFLLMRPQKKEQKRVQAMLASMEVGDTALTTSGFYGVIIDITDDDVIVEFGNNKKFVSANGFSLYKFTHDIFCAAIGISGINIIYTVLCCKV